MSKSLLEKVAIVIGGSRGIGAAVVQQLAAAGATVIATYTDAKDKTERLVSDLPALHGDRKHIATRVDLYDPLSVAAVFETAEILGGVDIVIVAGSARILDKRLADVTDDEFAKVSDFNIKGVFVVLREAAKRVKDNGRILVFSTPYTAQPQARRAITGASKAASDAMALALARELGERQITVNSIMPGPTETDSFLEQVPPEAQAQLAQMVPFGRLGKPGDIADIAVFLCSEPGRWITGQTIRATGGLL